MKAKKAIAFLLATILTSMAFAGCSKKDDIDKNGTASSTQSQATNTPDKSNQPVTIKYCVPGSAPVDNDKVLALVNEKMAADINVKIALEFIPWDAWDQKINLKLTTGDEFDLLQIMQTHSKLIADNALTDITQIIEKEGKNYLANVPQDIISAAKVNGKLYIMPSYWYEPAVENIFIIRKDLRDKYNLKNPTTPQEVLDQLDVIMKDWNGNFKPYIPMDAKGISPTGGTRSAALHGAYEEYPFIVKDELAIFYGDNTVGSWIESEVFKKDALYFADAYKRGLISPDILTIQAAQKTAQVESGEWYVLPSTSFDPTKSGLPVDSFEVITLGDPNKPVLRPMTVKDTIGIPYTSKNPEAAVKFINWLHSDQKNYDLFLYGIEGEHYTQNEGRDITKIIDPTTKASNYSFPDWMIGNLNLIKYSANSMVPEVAKRMYTKNDNAINHIADGFTFDGSKVQAELAEVKTAISTYILPVYVGVVPYEKGFASALEQVKKVGLEKVMTEYKAQYEAFLAKIQ